MQRKRIRRDRTGCVACKARKIKCDEQRPTCSACNHREIECEYTLSKQDLLAAKGLKSRRNSTEEVENQAERVSSDADIAEIPRPDIIITKSPSLKHTILPASSTVSQIRLFHHFTSVVATQMNGVSDNSAAALRLWTSSVPALALDNDYVIHAILAISAKDLEFKLIKNSSEREKMTISVVEHETNAIQALNKALAKSQGQDATLDMFITVLMLLWLSLMGSNTLAAKGHCVGARYLLSLTPPGLFKTELGIALLDLYAQLDIVMSHCNLCTTDAQFSICHRTKAMDDAVEFQAECHMAYLTQELRAIQTNRISLLADEHTFLTHHTVPLTHGQVQGILDLLRRTCRWYTRAKRRPEFQVRELDPSDWTADHPFGSVVCKSERAAVLMTQYHRLMNGLFKTLCCRASFGLSPLKESILIETRRIFAGALDMEPSSYSTSLLAFDALFNSMLMQNDCINAKSLQDYQTRMMNRLLSSSAKSVWGFANPLLLPYEVLHQAILFSIPGMEDSQQFTSAILETRVMEDFTEKSLRYTPVDHFLPGHRFWTHGIWLRSDGKMDVIVTITDISQDGQLTCQLDEEASVHWTNLARQYDMSTRYTSDVPIEEFNQILIDEGCGDLLHPKYKIS